MAVFKPVLVLVVLSISTFNGIVADGNPSGTGKAIYTAGRNPISTYFKEHKNKLRPYLKPETGISVHDETSGSPAYSSYYDSSSSYESSNYPSASSLTNTKDDNFGSNGYMDSLYDSSNPAYEASSNIYSVSEPETAASSSSNPGYYAAEPSHDSYSPPAYTPPVSDEGGYYGSSDSAGHVHHQLTSGYHGDTYSNPPSALPQPPSYPSTHTYAEPVVVSPVMEPATYHHTPTREHEPEVHHEPAYEPVPEVMHEPAHDGEEEDEGQPETGYMYDYATVMDDEDMILDKPKPGKPGKPSLGSLLGGGGGGAAPPAPPAAPTPPVDNPLSFLNLVGTDFQPGRLVNIFFGLFIMLFMIITHGYALWILGIAYLPGTRSLNDWQIDSDKLNGVCDAVLDALEYWGNRVD